MLVPLAIYPYEVLEKAATEFSHLCRIEIVRATPTLLDIAVIPSSDSQLEPQILFSELMNHALDLAAIQFQESD